MTGNIIHKQGDSSQNFNPPKLTKEIYEKILDMLWNGSVLFETLQEVKKNGENCDDIRNFKAVAREVFNFFKTVERPPSITRESWNTIREYYFNGVEAAQQLDMCLQASPEESKRFSMVKEMALTTFGATDNKALYEFFHQDPYKED